MFSFCLCGIPLDSQVFCFFLHFAPYDLTIESESGLCPGTVESTCTGICLGVLVIIEKKHKIIKL